MSAEFNLVKVIPIKDNDKTAGHGSSRQFVKIRFKAEVDYIRSPKMNDRLYAPLSFCGLEYKPHNFRTLIGYDPFVKGLNKLYFMIIIKLRSYKSSEHINEKGVGQYHGFSYLSIMGPNTLNVGYKTNLNR